MGQKYKKLIFKALTLPALMGILFCTPIEAAESSRQIFIRDAEIESYIESWTKDVVRAAGMTTDQVNIVLVQNSEVNAFVAGGANIFIHTGLIAKTDRPQEVVGVIAHELGHIEGGHLTRTGDMAKNASFEAMVGAIVGIGAALATGDGNAAAAGISIGQGQAMNSFLAYSRTQESSADQAGLRFLTSSGQSPYGLLSFLKKLSSEELLPASQQSQFMRTHPLTSMRIESLENQIKKSGQADAPPTSLQDQQFRRMKAKLAGFITPQQILYLYPSSNTSTEAVYARAISEYRMNHVAPALKYTDTLIGKEPDNPFFHELKGQMLYDFGQISTSIQEYEKAVSLLPTSGLIRTSLAQSLIESSSKDETKLQEAIDHLKRAEKDEPRLTRIKRLLATAYGRLGKESEARVYLAEEALMQGRKSDAVEMAKATLKQLPPNSPEAIRAKDIINAVGDKGEKR